MVQLKPGQSLYEAIGVEKTASAGDIRKAYLKLAVQLHPDKNPGDDEAKERFQTLQKVYSVLSDPEKRKVYDQTGCLDDAEELSGDKFDSLYSFYRTMFAPVTEDAIEEFGVSYRGSDEERAELLQYYMRFEGNMDKVFQWVMLSEPETDSHRFMDIIDAAIKAKHATRYKQYTTWAKEVSGRPRPNPAAVSKKRQRAEGGKGKGKGKKGEASGSGRDEAALVAMMKKRREGAFTGMLEGLAAKYGCDGALEAEPTDEEFEAARRRMEAHKASAGKSKKNSKK